MYKLKYWIYGDYDCEEMESQLNHMAAKGYKLRSICLSQSLFPIGWACFEKTETAKRYRYAADVVTEEDKKDYLQLCKDAGWEEAAWSGDNVCIFRTDRPNAEPIYTDSASRFSKMAEYNREKYGSVNPYLYIGLIIGGIAAFAALLLYAYRSDEPDGILWSFLSTGGIHSFILLTWLMFPLRRALVLITVGIAEQRLKRGEEPGMSLYPVTKAFATLMPLTCFGGFVLTAASLNVSTGEMLIYIGMMSLFFGAFWLSYALEAYFNKKGIGMAGIMFTLALFLIAFAITA